MKPARLPTTTQPTRPAFAGGTPRRSPLDGLFTPHSIAVVGASDRPGSVGRAVMENLRSFGGTIFAVNPARRLIFDQDAFPSISVLPEVPDLAVIVVPAVKVPAVVRECADAGVPAAIVISAGFRECGAEGAALESATLAAARGRVRLLGPNCLGVMVPHHGLNASFAAGMAHPGSVAFISQSGALCSALLDWSQREAIGFSAFVSIGAMADLGWGDLIDYFGDDPHTKSIVCYMESVTDARAFLSAARAVAPRKPIVILKVGHTAAGARAAASHTGALTGSDDVVSAAFDRAGVLRVRSIEDLFDMAEVLEKQPRPKGPGLAIVTNAGGPGALAADQALSSGAQLANLSPDCLAALNRLLPPQWSHANPVDLLGAADSGLYGRAAELLLAEPEVNGLLAILTPQSMTDPGKTAAQLVKAAAGAGKPVLASWMGGLAVEEARAFLNAAGIPTYDYPDAAARAFALMWQQHQHIEALYERPTLPAPMGGAAGRQQTMRSFLERLRMKGRTLLTEIEANQVLAAYSIPVLPTKPARTENEAVAIARRLRFPVALKLWSETLTHKARVGGVHLHLRNATEVRRAWRAIRSAAIAHAGSDAFAGVVVQPMAGDGGVELILGSSVDPQFGPVMLFGAGGSLVETLDDRALALPPLNGTLARQLMEKTRVFAAFTGTNGRAGFDLQQLDDLLVRFSQLIAEQRWIAEMDVNPLLVSSRGAVALDARIVLHPKTVLEADLPRLAIRPYPAEYVRVFQVPKLGRITIRPIRPEDEMPLAAFHASLSDRTIHERYFGGLALASRTEHTRLARICFADYDRELTLVAEYHGRNGVAQIIAIGRIIRGHGADAELGLTVADAWQGRGLGTRLLAQLTEAGRSEGLTRIHGTVLADNGAMLRLCQSAGFTLDARPEGGEVHVEILL